VHVAPASHGPGQSVPAASDSFDSTGGWAVDVLHAASETANRAAAARMRQGYRGSRRVSPRDAYWGAHADTPAPTIVSGVSPTCVMDPSLGRNRVTMLGGLLGFPAGAVKR